MKTFDIVTKRTVTQEQIDDLLVDAFEGGVMSDWCEGVVIIEEPEEKYKYASEVLTRGGKLKVVDTESEVYELTLNKLLHALGETGLDFNNYDAVDADAVIQTAIFGEVIYG